jgi:hypothetical protein
VVSTVAHQYADAVTHVFKQALIEMRRRAYLRGVVVEQVARGQIGNVMAKPLPEILSQPPRRESIRGREVRLVEAVRPIGRMPIDEPASPNTDKRLVARLVVQESDGKVWVIATDNGHGCMLPGGGAEPDEPLQEAAVREALEEVGLLCEVTAWLCDQESEDEVVRYYRGRRVA